MIWCMWGNLHIHGENKAVKRTCPPFILYHREGEQQAAGYYSSVCWSSYLRFEPTYDRSLSNCICAEEITRQSIFSQPNYQCISHCAPPATSHQARGVECCAHSSVHQLVMNIKIQYENANHWYVHKNAQSIHGIKAFACISSIQEAGVSIYWSRDFSIQSINIPMGSLVHTSVPVLQSVLIDS